MVHETLKECLYHIFLLLNQDPWRRNLKGIPLNWDYDLSKPGDYSVYLEIYDPAGPKDGSGHWLRTNTVNFKI
jgi:hypothetical protein